MSSCRRPVTNTAIVKAYQIVVDLTCGGPTWHVQYARDLCSYRCIITVHSVNAAFVCVICVHKVVLDRSDCKVYIAVHQCYEIPDLQKELDELVTLLTACPYLLHRPYWRFNFSVILSPVWRWGASPWRAQRDVTCLWNSYSVDEFLKL